jgi:hypothetical protein
MHAVRKIIHVDKHPSQGGCYFNVRKQDIRTCRGKTEDHQQSEQQL